MLIDGRQIAQEVKNHLKDRFSALPKKRVVFVVFQNTFAIEQFIGIKTRVGVDLGVDCVTATYDGVLDTAHAVEYVKQLGKEGYDGIVVQLPLPAVLDTQAVLDAVPALVDIDVLGGEAIENQTNGISMRLAPVVRAVETIIDHYAAPYGHKQIVILGKGRLVGGAIARYFDRRKLIYKIFTNDALDAEYYQAIKAADIIISGIGQPNFIKPEMIKPGVVLIDAGTSEQNGKVAGDVDPACAEVAAYMTPVPGGVGPIAVASLYYNLLKH